MDCFASNTQYSTRLNLIKSISKSFENLFFIDFDLIFESFLVRLTIPQKHLQITKTIIQ